jgi:ArsR family transcriptional regulator, arsenate/arsenite/antimonite-responsive transcriptional repressor
MKRAATKSTAANTPAMTDEQFRAISRVLADPRRFAILEQVAAAGPGEGLPCGNLQEHAEISPATISHHLKELNEAGLVEVHRDGRCANLSLQRDFWQAYLKRLSSL